MVSRHVHLFKRFKPDNIMHVLHDDLLPLFHTLNEVGLSSGEKGPAAVRGCLIKCRGTSLLPRHGFKAIGKAVLDKISPCCCLGSLSGLCTVCLSLDGCPVLATPSFSPRLVSDHYC